MDPEAPAAEAEAPAVSVAPEDAVPVDREDAADAVIPAPARMTATADL